LRASLVRRRLPTTANAYDTRAHLERAFDPRRREAEASFSIVRGGESVDESSTSATRTSLGAGRERLRKGPAEARSPSRERSRAPGSPIWGREGAGDSLSPRTTPAKIDCRCCPAKGDSLKSIRVLSAASEPLMGMPPRQSPPPLHAARHFRDVGIAHEGRAFVTATVAPRSGEPSAA